MGRRHFQGALALLGIATAAAAALMMSSAGTGARVDVAQARYEPSSGLGDSLPAKSTPTTVALAPPPRGAPSDEAKTGGYLHAGGSRLLDRAGREVRITGVSWFGMETATFAPHGLWARSWQELLDAVVAMGFNAIRLPFSNQLFERDSRPNGIDFHKNPDLVGLSGVEIMDRIIAGAGERRLRVMLDRHRPDAGGQSELWYTDRYSEERWIADWQMLAGRYKGNQAVVAADLHNEPHGNATWGGGDRRVDWRLAAERAGNAILAVNSDWLIVVEGVERHGDDFYWWGGNLRGAREFPVRLSVPGRLVYSPHDYGPGVYNQRWFLDPSFPDNLPAIWDRHWGYLAKEGQAPVLMGEFGGRSVGSDAEGKWQRALVSYLRDNGSSYTYWTLNPNSGDTGGLLNDDWQTLHRPKLELLRTYQWPRWPSAQLPDD